MVDVSLAVLIGHLVAKVVLGRPIVGLLHSLALDLGPWYRSAGRFQCLGDGCGDGRLELGDDRGGDG